MYILHNQEEKMSLRMIQKNRLWAGAALILALAFLPAGRAQWEKPLQPSLSGGPLTWLIPHPLDNTKFLIASQHQVFEGGAENSWQPLWPATDRGSVIRRIVSFVNVPDYVFALTSDRIFMGNLKDRSWQPVYQDSGKPPLSFAVHPQNPNRWFVGTQKGLWETDNAGKTWSPSRIFPGSHAVTLLLFDRDRFFIADENKLYCSRSDAPARGMLDLSRKETEPISPEDDAAADPEEDTFYFFKIHDLVSVKQDPQKLFLATEKGVFESHDGGSRWENLSQSGLQSAAIRQLAFSEKENRLYAATPRGIYVYEPHGRRWNELFQGLSSNRALSVAVFNEEKLIAITEDGFVQYPIEPFRPEAGPGIAIYQPPQETLSLFRELIRLEPAARDVQKQVIHYANVSNWKTKRWHGESRLAGLLPTFSFGRDFSTGNNIDIDRGGTNDPDKFISGPSDINRGWDGRVSWNFGDTIYSSAQTSIDSREKLMVELRNDLLSEVTRLYYERRRLQIEIVFLPSASEQDHLERLLRMDELTTLLDGMTDGFFSKRLEKIYDEMPEFNALWIYGTEREESGATNNTTN